MKDDSYIIWCNFIDNGSECSFAALYDHYADKLYSYGLSLGFDEDTCKDAIQDVFIKIYDYKSKLKSAGNPASFLFRSFKNRLIDIYRANKAEIALEDIQDSFSLNVTILDNIISEESDMKLKSTVQSMLDKLTGTQREAIYMRYIVGLDYSEISEILNINQGSARKLMHRAMAKLRQQSIDDFKIAVLLFAILYYQ